MEYFVIFIFWFRVFYILYLEVRDHKGKISAIFGAIRVTRITQNCAVGHLEAEWENNQGRQPSRSWNVQLLLTIYFAALHFPIPPLLCVTILYEFIGRLDYFLRARARLMRKTRKIHGRTA